MSRTEFKSILAVCLLYMIRMIGLFMVIPVLPLIGPDLPGSTPFLIGLALGIYGLSQAALQIPLGLLSDRYGRKPIILGGLLVFIAGSIVAGASDSIVGIIAGRCLQGVGAIASTLMALVGDLTRVENRSRAMMMIGMSIGGSFFLSLILGPYLLGYVGISGLFYLTAALGGVGIFVLFLLVPSSRVHSLNLDSRNGDSKLLTEKLIPITTNPQLLRLDLGIFLVHYLLMAGFMAFPQLLRLTGQVEDNQHHLVYMAVMLTSFLLMGPLIWVADRRSLAKPILTSMIFVLIVSFVIMALRTDLMAILAGLFLFFMAFNLMEAILPSQLSRLAPAGTRGTAMGVYSTSQFAGAFCGGLVGGWILQYWDISYLMVANALVCLFWLLPFFTMRAAENLVGRTVYFDKKDPRSAIELMEALSSVVGVEDVVLVGGDQVTGTARVGTPKVAYLKVNKAKFEDRFLAACSIEKVI